MTRLNAFRWGTKHMGSNALSLALDNALSDGAGKAYAIADAAINDLLKVGGEAAKLAGPTAQRMAEAIYQVSTGNMAPDVGAEVIDRYLEALDEVKLGVVEAGEVAAVKRARQGLALAKEVGLALAKAAASTLAASL